MVTYSPSSGAFSGVYAEYQKVIVVRLIGRILELKTLVADVPDVAVTAVAGVCGERKINAVCLAVFDLDPRGTAWSTCRLSMQR